MNLPFSFTRQPPAPPAPAPRALPSRPEYAGKTSQIGRAHLAHFEAQCRWGKAAQELQALRDHERGCEKYVREARFGRPGYDAATLSQTIAALPGIALEIERREEEALRLDSDQMAALTALGELWSEFTRAERELRGELDAGRQRRQPEELRRLIESLIGGEPFSSRDYLPR